MLLRSRGLGDVYKRQRILFESIGHPVLRLIRTKMGPIMLDENLLPGEWRYLSDYEIKLLLNRGGVRTDACQ